MAFCDQERFNLDVLEAVTGVKPATLRQWETREVYVCELRHNAAMEVNLIRSSDTPRRRRKAVELLQKYERGWRSYTLGDLIRISFVVVLTEAGVETSEAGKGAMCLILPESEPNSHPAGRALTRLLTAPDLPDEYLVYVPKLVHLDNPARFRYDPAKEKPELDKIARALRLMGERAAVIVNLSRMRRNVLQQIDQALKNTEAVTPPALGKGSSARL